VAKFKYKETIITNHSFVYEEVKRRLNSGNARMPEFIVLQFVGKKLNIKIHKTMIFFTIVLYGCETWSLTVTEEHRLRVFENRALRKMFGPKVDEVT
jgi:hypothetical protein